jgi:hypothetical protein
MLELDSAPCTGCIGACALQAFFDFFPVKEDFTAGTMQSDWPTKIFTSALTPIVGQVPQRCSLQRALPRCNALWRRGPSGVRAGGVPIAAVQEQDGGARARGMVRRGRHRHTHLRMHACATT